MTDIFSRPRMIAVRIVANIVTGILLAAILAGLVCVWVNLFVDRCSKNVSENQPIRYQQQVPYGAGR